LFGNAGGFEIIIDILENAKVEGDLSISVLGCLAQIITFPSVVLHKNFIVQYGQRISTAIRKRLL
jgi:hypothetical protein